MNNFPFTHEGKTYWYSRSVACTMYLFIYCKFERKWYILISKRGKGCPSNVGKWNCPGGYLDFNESLEDGARRECYEETGIQYSGPLKLASISTNLNSSSQNVVCSFYGMEEVDTIEDVKCKFSMEHNEKDEVEDIELLDLEDLFTWHSHYHTTFAFGHDDMIREIFKKRININWVKKLIIRWGENLSKIDLRIS